ARVGVDFEELLTHMAGLIPVARVGEPEDIAHAVSFLAGEDAGYISGQVLYVSGGPQG
ncbi:SDR family oxidoreductase, partial [Streptomyces decoyicus]